jgi:hypothetical protein
MKISLYFIFYVVMILELLIFIMDRDEATDQHLADLSDMIMLSENLAHEFEQPLDINVPENSTAMIYGSSLQRALGRKGDSTHVILSPLGLWSDAERQTVSFSVYDSTGTQVAGNGGSGPFKLSVNRTTGDAVLSTVLGREGTYRFTARCSVRRSVPGYYPSLVRDSVTTKLKRVLGSDMLVKTDHAVPFTITVKGEGQRLPPCEYCGQGPYRK